MRNWLACIALFVTIGFAAFALYIDRPNKNTSPAVDVARGRINEPGNVNFTVFGRWGCQRVIFRDVGFDGNLDLCVVSDPNGSEQYLKPGKGASVNGAKVGWDIWVKRYIEIREEATEPTKETKEPKPRD